jgi:hypothetical protein
MRAEVLLGAELKLVIEHRATALVCQHIISGPQQLPLLWSKSP